MALRIGKVLSTVSSVTGALGKVDTAGNFNFLSTIGGAIKGSGWDLKSVGNIVGTVSGVDITKSLSIEGIGKFLGIDLNISNLIPQDLSVDKLMGDFSFDNIMKDMDLPDMDSLGSAIGTSADSSTSGAANEIQSAMGNISSELGGLTDFGNMDWFGQLGTGMSLF